MKFLSLFTKAPQHQRFSYTPRFYDPVKEELEQRESRIKKELEKERGVESEDTTAAYRTRIAGSFQAARKRGKQTGGTSVAMTRLFILLFITVFLIAFLEFGRPALYMFVLFVPFYLYLKFKSR